tara:strand:+ start:450 stop:734 length:285 start_codon:yes stop_codon:yes gene_type:complete
MSKFGDLLGGKTVPAATPPAPAPVAEKPPAPPKPAPAPVVSKSAPLKEELFKKSKDELEQIGRGVGIELDKRLSHSKLVVQLQSHIEKNKVKIK